MSFILRYFLLLIKNIYTAKSTDSILVSTRLYITLFAFFNMLLNKYLTTENQQNDKIILYIQEKIK